MADTTLRLGCRHTAEDTAMFEWEDSTNVPLVITIDSRSGNNAFMSEDDARQLFNWLGIWLHTC